MESKRRNRNRGYRQLRVWQDAIQLYTMTCEVFRPWPSDLRRVASQQIASVDSIHRNIAEGYCRKSILEYLNFINYALGSAGESVSGLHAYLDAGQLSEEEFERLDEGTDRLEQGLVNLRDSLRAQDPVEWSDRRIIRESNATYGS